MPNEHQAESSKSQVDIKVGDFVKIYYSKRPCLVVGVSNLVVTVKHDGDTYANTYTYLKSLVERIVTYDEMVAYVLEN